MTPPMPPVSLDLRRRKRRLDQVGAERVRLRYQELLSHIKACSPTTAGDLQRLSAGLPQEVAAALLGAKDHLVAAHLAAREFGLAPHTVLSKTKGIPMSMGNETGVWELDARGRCTFRPWVNRAGRPELGPPVRVRGFGDVPA
jgi:hypothetical protein